MIVDRPWIPEFFAQKYIVAAKHNFSKVLFLDQIKKFFFLD